MTVSIVTPVQGGIKSYLAGMGLNPSKSTFLLMEKTRILNKEFPFFKVLLLSHTKRVLAQEVNFHSSTTYPEYFLEILPLFPISTN